MSELLNGKGFMRGHFVNEISGWTPDMPILDCEILAAPVHDAVTDILPDIIVNMLDVSTNVKCSVRSILALSPNQPSGQGSALLQ